MNCLYTEPNGWYYSLSDHQSVHYEGYADGFLWYLDEDTQGKIEVGCEVCGNEKHKHGHHHHKSEEKHHKRHEHHKHHEDK